MYLSGVIYGIIHYGLLRWVYCGGFIAVDDPAMSVRVNGLWAVVLAFLFHPVT